MFIPNEGFSRDGYVSNKDWLSCCLNCRQFSLMRGRSPPSPLESDKSTWPETIVRQQARQRRHFMWEGSAAKFDSSHMSATARTPSGEEHPWVRCGLCFSVFPRASNGAFIPHPLKARVKLMYLMTSLHLKTAAAVFQIRQNIVR